MLYIQRTMEWWTCSFNISKIMSHLLLLFFFLCISFSSQSNNIAYSSNCLPYMCGSVNISYPFWRADEKSATQYCGYEAFEIKCSESNISEITLGGDSYFVREIDHASDTIYLSYNEVPPVAPGPNNAQNSCPRVGHNITLGTLPLEYAMYSVNLTFHFGCNGRPRNTAEIPCFEPDDTRACLEVMNGGTEESDRDEFLCDQIMVTTVSRLNLESFPDLPKNFGNVLEGGFGLRWRRMDGCEKCEESNGRCGLLNPRGFTCFCSDGTTTRSVCKGTRQNYKMKLVIGFGSALLSIVIIFIIYFILKQSSSNCITSLKPKNEDDKNIEAFVMHYGSLSTKRYTYTEIKKITNSFKVKLGHGGFGQVFKGKLSDGRLVAVKVLNSSKTNGQEFINEVASIGRTAHVNIVTLLGFCSENKKRALVYEYMPNGSLEKFVYSNVHMGRNEQIGVKELYQIALGIASGLDYLHRGCSTRILHLDIKPHNILLDEDYCPKIADFGLAKLYSRKESIVSMLETRGTIGYIAPEVYNKNFGGVSHKSDVYSYGMLLLEIVGGRKNVDAGVGSGRTSETYFSDWIYKRLHKDDFLLDSVTNAEENDYARKMTIVGLWCIQPAPNQRPSINEVIEMLEGSMEVLKVPPKPFFSSPPRSPATIYSTSERTSEIA